MANAPLDAILLQLNKALDLLQAAEEAWPQALPPEEAGSQSSEALEALLHIATHEIGSHLAFCLQDLDTVRQRMAIRAAYPQYTDTQFSEMAREGWSLQRVKRMHEALPAISLAEHSLAIRTIHACVSALPKLAHDRLQA